ncbi:hypothetical protein [Arthrobacter sp. AFG7.2]|uniref:hypothetical protein n=1 Tax=Arthrobacter sp. AFG7.2 TaxID=1688693 RepID=UPI001CB93334|nr:hypothetical protein [Arthrobacter sp. AFG7.2]
MGEQDDRPNLYTADLGGYVRGDRDIDVFQDRYVSYADIYQSVLVNVTNCL